MEFVSWDGLKFPIWGVFVIIQPCPKPPTSLQFRTSYSLVYQRVNHHSSWVNLNQLINRNTKNGGLARPMHGSRPRPRTKHRSGNAEATKDCEQRLERIMGKPYGEMLGILAGFWCWENMVILWNVKYIIDRFHASTNAIGSMYSIYANIWGILMVNVTIYGIHGSYGNVYYILRNNEDIP